MPGPSSEKNKKSAPASLDVGRSRQFLAKALQRAVNTGVVSEKDAQRIRQRAGIAAATDAPGAPPSRAPKDSLGPAAALTPPKRKSKKRR